ncbi:MAG: epoxyqueuosine reductase QueH [Eubacteriales bacterium]|nr:epoxyqueuosine reductase QueH [Lachnospiraceae bacterium]MDO5127861.1 epoxyqueuosine reductase QueH [Eubacteriales bacterium]
MHTIKEKLLLHVCCAPCSSYVLELLSAQYDITVYFYNPNITRESEYGKRVEELKRFVAEAPFAKNVRIIEEVYAPDEFFEMAKGLEDEPERGTRCYKCYEQRMRKTAFYAKKNGYDLFTTTLSISPHKNATWLNEIGERLGAEYGIAYMYSDFKKKNGYARSIELSKEYNLYRQNYCGCVFSEAEANKRNHL